jgi:cholesterol transport system auxiliary component
MAPRDAKSRAARLAAGLIALTLAGCMSAPLADFDLTPVATDVRSAHHGSIRVRQPTLSEDLDSNRIMARLDKDTIAVLPGGQWSDRLPDLIAERMTETLDNAGLGAVGEGGSAAVNYDLNLDVRAFELDVANSEASVALQATLVKLANGRTVASRLFEQRVKVASKDAGVVAPALNQALASVMAGVAEMVAGSR